MIKIVTLAGVAFGSDFAAEDSARKIAKRKFEDFYQEFGQRVNKSTHVPIREMYLVQGFTCYLIKAEVDLNEADMVILAARQRILAELERIDEYRFYVPGAVGS